MRKPILPGSRLALAALAITPTLAYGPVTKALARADGRSAPAVPSDHRTAGVASATTADERR